MTDADAPTKVGRRAPAAHVFQKKQDGCIKVVLDPAAA